MTDQPFREIQLSGKQLFFLFMALVVLSVVIFLLGVSVGRGVRGTLGPAAEATEAAQMREPVVGTMPPPTAPRPGDLSYHETLQGRPTSPATNKPADAPSRPASPPPPPTAEPTPATPTTTTVKPSTAPPAPQAAKPGAAATSEVAKPGSPPPAAGGWLVQTGAFRTKPAADQLASQLRAKGFAAFVDGQGPDRSKYRVRVGPFADRAQAEAAATRLKSEANVGVVVLR
jgi:DedD protein